MATFQRENEQAPCKITVPDKVTVKQQLEYYSVAGSLSGKEFWFRKWEAAKTIIQDWECELMPDVDTDLDTLTNPLVTGVLIWAGIQVSDHINSLQVVSKNS